MNILFSKATLSIVIFLSIVLFFAVGCSRRKIVVEHVKQKKPSITSEKKSSSPGKAKLGKPYYINGIMYYPKSQPENYTQKGLASWYGKDFHGKKTANGEIYNMYAMTAAHKTLPLQTWVKVHNLRNNKEIVVRINDRGPFVRRRIIDLSYTGAKKIGIVEKGTAPVIITVLGKLKNPKAKKREYVPVNWQDGNFSVQVGAFQVKSNANQYKQELSASYDNVHIVTHQDHRGTFYRVRIGKYSKLIQASLLEKQLSVDGLKTLFLVAE